MLLVSASVTNFPFPLICLVFFVNWGVRKSWFRRLIPPAGAGPGAGCRVSHHHIIVLNKGALHCPSPLYHCTAPHRCTAALPLTAVPLYCHPPLYRCTAPHHCTGVLPLTSVPLHCPSPLYCCTAAHFCTDVLQGGYFVINGSEKVLIAQERMANNHVFVFKKSQPAKYSYVSEIRWASHPIPPHTGR